MSDERIQPGAEQGSASSGRRRRILRLGFAIVGLLAVAATVFTYRLFVWPSTNPPQRADAVVVFAGADGERQAEGARLVADGVAPVLVISDGGRPGLSKYQLCRDPGTLTVICFSPAQDDSRSEAREFARLAQANGWRSLALVTSVTHVRRAELLLTRCHRGPVFTVGTELRNSASYETGLQIAHEWVGLLQAVTTERDC